MFSTFALSTVLLVQASSPSTSSGRDEEASPATLFTVIQEPFVEFLNPEFAASSSEDIHAWRLKIEHEKDQANRHSQELGDQWKKMLSAAREKLESLNRQSSVDTEASALRRSRLHIDMAALERSLKESERERERTNRNYELQLTRIWLAEHWPRRREEVRRKILEGQGRDRRHGDVEDTGYRKLGKDSGKDVETGERAARQMTAGGWLPPELRDEEVQIFVRRMAANLAANSDFNVPIHVTVLDSAELKAIALPGGFLYVTSGVVMSAQSESELAGVLSREIARIAARHAVRSSRVSWMSRLFVPLTQVVGGIFAGGPANPAAYYGIGYGAQGLGGMIGRALNGTNEKFQFEADQLGVQYAWKAGYDPSGFVAFLDSIAGKEHQFLTDEPAMRERLLNIFDEIEHLPPQRNPAPADSAAFNRIKRRLTF